MIGRWLYKKYITRICNAHPMFGTEYKGYIPLQQHPDEIAGFFHTIRKHEVKRSLEIVSAGGGVSSLIQVFKSPDMLVIVDDNKHHQAPLRKVFIPEAKEFIGNSRDRKIIWGVSELAPFDLLFIDGDHSFQGVRHDLNAYSGLVRPGGYMGFHDSQYWGGVKRVVEQLKTAQSFYGFDFIDEFITKRSSEPCGIALFKRRENA